MRELRTLAVSRPEKNVATLELARPLKSNAVDLDMWDELPLALDYLDQRDDVRVVRQDCRDCAIVLGCYTGLSDWCRSDRRMQVLLRGQGKNFCAGIDFTALNSISATVNVPCPGRAREALRRHILHWQVCQHGQCICD